MKPTARSRPTAPPLSTTSAHHPSDPTPLLPTAPMVPKARRGLLHILDASRYSLAGARRLFEESAARLELVGGIIAAGVLFWAQASFWQWFGFFALFIGVLVIETVNTAIEVLTDAVSPGWSSAAKNAKDLGSLAVGLMLLLTIGYVAAIAIGLGK